MVHTRSSSQKKQKDVQVGKSTSGQEKHKNINQQKLLNIRINTMNNKIPHDRILANIKILSLRACIDDSVSKTPRFFFGRIRMEQK
jgi:hypothetical protein